MKEQNQIIQMENNVEVVAKKSNPLLKFLKLALIGVTAFIVLTILFAVGSELINPAVDSVMHKIGLTESITTADTSPVAYAWDAPQVGKTGDLKTIGFSSNNDTREKTLAPLTNEGYDSNTSMWHYAYSQSGGQIDGNGGFTTGGYTLAAVDFRAIYYVDITITEEMRQAIKNGHLSEISISLYADSNGAKENSYEVASAEATLRYSVFLLSTTEKFTNDDATINKFSDEYHRKDIRNNQWTDYVPVNSHKEVNETLTIELTGDETKIRFGLAWYLTYEARSSFMGTQTSIYASAPKITGNGFTVNDYTPGQIQFNLSTDGRTTNVAGGTIEALNSNSYEDLASRINSTHVFDATYGQNVGFIAKPNYGYYFAGWKKSGGDITYDYDGLRYPKVEIIGGGYVTTQKVTMEACFVKIKADVGSTFEESSINMTWDYLQDSDGVATAQGPTVTLPETDYSGEGGEFELIGGRIGTSNEPENATINNISNPRYYSVDGSLFIYQGNVLPTQAGSYTMVTRVFIKGQTSNMDAELGFVYQNFKIIPINIAGTENYTITFVPFDDEENVIEPHVFNTKAYCPEPKKLRISLKPTVGRARYYVLTKDDYAAFTAESYSQNIYVTSPEKIATVKINASGGVNKNFTGTKDCQFDILPRDVSTLIMDTYFAKEIQANYGVYHTQDNKLYGKGLSYNGYQHRPDVVYVELYDSDGNIYKLYRAGISDNYAKIYSENYVFDGDSATYAPLFRIVNVDGGNPTAAYFNNVDAFTYDGSNGANAPRFTITMSGGTADLEGSVDIYFNIAELNLSDKKNVTIDNQADDPDRIYKNEEWEIDPDIVFVNATFDAIWVYNGSAYVPEKDHTITYAFANKNYAKYDLTEPANKAAFDELVRVKLGIGGGKLEDKKATDGTIVGQEYFTAWSGYFETSDITYENNKNVSRDANSVVVAEAKAIVPLKGNSTNTVATLFKINPIDLSATYSKDKLLGFFSFDAKTHADMLPDQRYTGSKYDRLPNSYSVYAHVKGADKGTELNNYDANGKLKDYSIRFGDEERDNINVASGGIVYVDGQGNYTGTITISFNILPMQVTAVNAPLTVVVDDKEVPQLAPKEYIGAVPNYQLDKGKTLVFEITYEEGSETKTTTRTLVHGIDFINLGTRSNNVNLTDLTTHANYIGVKLTCLDTFDPRYTEGASGNYDFEDEIFVYFAITERQLSSIENSQGNNIYTQWSTSGYTQIVYDGTLKEDLSIRCYGQGILDESEAMKGDLVIKDGAKYLQYGVDYEVIGWGDESTNVNAGHGAILIIQGIGNYAGTLEVPFTILPRDISSMSTDGITLEGYSFAYAYGEQITPDVVSVTYKEGSLELSLTSSDYEVGYTHGTRDNVNVNNGGAVVITGVGNYSGSIARNFEITPIDQTLTFENPANYNDAEHLKVEENEKAKDFADYFVNADGEYVVTLKATTTAVSSGMASSIVFMQTNANGFESGKVNVVEVSTEISGTGDNAIATTTATLKFANNAYGIVHVYATHVDAHGNYNKYERSAYTFKIYGKRQNSAPEISELYQMTYGDNAFTVFTGLKSEALINGDDYTLEYDSSVLNITKVTNANNPTFTIDERKVSEEGVTVTFSHKDFVGLTVTEVDGKKVVSNDERAFVAFEKSFVVKVMKRELHVSIVSKSVEYGTKPANIVFEYAFKTPIRVDGEITSWVNGNVNGDVTLPTEFDPVTGEPLNGIVNGIKTDYSPTLHSGVGKYTLNVLTSDDNFKVLSENYAISYGTGEFEVTKKMLTLSLNGISADDPDAIAFSKLYGAANPTGLRLAFVGLINETDSSASDFKAPTIAFVDQNGNTIDEFTEAGIYTVRTTGGSANNYDFTQGSFNMEIKPTSVRISLSSLTVNYNGLSHDPNQAVINGIVGGMDPISGYTVNYDLIDASGAVAQAGTKATNAGSYKIRVTFIPSESEKNYVRTEVDFAGAITINKVAPIISFGSYAVEYSGEAIDPRLIRPSVSGIGEEPKVTTVTKKLFAASRPEGEDINFDNCHTAGNYELFFPESFLPVEKGVYDVIFVYVANPQDNYTDLVVRFREAVNITTGIATITERMETVTVTYNAKGHSVNLTDHFFPIKYKPKDGAEIDISSANTTILYKIDGEYVSTLPVNAGTYDVRVSFKPIDAQSDIVTEWNYDFAGMLVIDPVDIFDPNRNYVSLARSQTTYVYNAYGHPLDATTDVQVNGVPGDTSKPKGTIGILYLKGSKSYAEPVEAGTYDVQVTYISVLGDNYKPITSESKVFTGAVVINKAKVTINSITPVSYVFNGAGKSANASSCYGVQLKDGSYEIPEGELSYKYRKSGTANQFTSTLPKDVGDYDVRITFTAAFGGNYLDGTEITETRRVSITKATPTIIINDMEFNYGEPIVVNYTIRGAQFDLEGPMNEISANPSVVTIRYGTRFTAVGGGSSFEWSLTPPTKSGKYSIRIEFNPSSSSNYIAAIQPQYDVLTIKNIIPKFELEGKVVSYDGARHVANEVKVYYGEGADKTYYTKWDGVQESGNFYRGTIGYEYRKSGSGVWTTVAPSAVGEYDVRVRYYENAVSDVFTSSTGEYLGALVIEQLVINVMPIYGQGHLYDGVAIDGSAIAYVYSYEKDGYKYNVYTRAGDLDSKEVIDFSKAEYVQENGYVYTIITEASLMNEAWLSYYERALRLVSGSFVDGETLVSFEFSALGVNEGKGEFTAENGKRYVVDLDLNLVYLANDTKYTLSNQNGYYFSIVDGKGAVNVVEIIPQNVVYPTEGSKVGLYTVTNAGKQTVYNVNLEALTATANGEVYAIYENVGIISYNTGANVAQIKVDFSSFYEVTEEGIAVYKSANGSAYLINLNTSEVEKVAVLSVDVVEFDYVDYRGASATAIVNVSELSEIYTSNAYIGEYAIRNDLKAIVDLNRGVARIHTYYLINEISTGLYSFNNSNAIQEAFTQQNLVKTNRANEYTFKSNLGNTYLIDLNNMIARDVTTKYIFDGESARMYQEVNGEEIGFDVDIRSLSYQVIRNGKLHSTTTLYGRYYEVEESELIAGNEWSGNMSILAQGAGSYEILQGSLSISSNYRLYFVGGVYYQIDKAKLTVSFEGEEGAVYDGNNKFIRYEIHGVLAGDSVGVSQSYDGDNLNVTDGGYRTYISINSPNYYLEGGVSEWYYIAPARMQEIVVPESKPIIYDGAKHYVELTDVERGAKVSYAGSQTAPYFVEPGTYSVIATVSKPNYVSLEVELTLTITKAKYVVYPLDVPGSLEYGDALPSLMCDSTLGYIALDPGQVLLPSVTTYTWTFTPYSQDFYRYYEGNSLDGSTITGTIELKVNKAKANVEIKGDLVQSETDPSAIIGYVNGLSHNESELITIEYLAGDGTRYAKMPTAPGKYTVLITYAGDENYAETTYTTVLTIEQESNLEWLVYVGSAIGVLLLLSTVFFLVRKGKKLD